ncbi:hypothetical protein HK101_000569 [Irineochytrium annulatum]|nr:hypothetical protein HK101_000569 [Irineochytrium annulatum]
MDASIARQGQRAVFPFALSFVATILALVAAGTQYAHSLYSPLLASRLQLTASGGVWGYFADAESGSSATMIFVVAALLIGSGYSTMAEIYDMGPVKGSAVYVGIAYFVVGLGSSGTFAAAIGTNLRNWDPKYRGFATGLPLAALGLSASLYALVGTVFFMESDSDSSAPTKFSFTSASFTTLSTSLNVHGFLFFLGVSTMAINLLSTFLVKDLRPRKSNPQTSNEPLRSAPLDEGQHADEARSETSPLLPENDPYRHHILHYDSVTPILHPSTVVTAPRGAGINAANHPHPAHPAHAAHAAQAVEPVHTMSPSENLRAFLTSTDARLLFLILLIVSGSGLAYSNAIGAIVASLASVPAGDGGDGSENGTSLLTEGDDGGPRQRNQALNVAVFSIVSCFSRIASGLASDGGMRWWRIDRSSWLAVASLLMMAGHGRILLMFGEDRLWDGDLGSLVGSTVLVGLGFGCVNTVMAVLISDVFGQKYFSTNWGVTRIGTAIGGQLFGFLFGLMLDLEASRPHEELDSGSVRSCVGSRCFVSAFWLWASMNLIAFGLSLALWYRRAKAARAPQ